MVHLLAFITFADIGNMTVPATYTVLASNLTTTCTTIMSGSASVTLTTTSTPGNIVISASASTSVRSSRASTR